MEAPFPVIERGEGPFLYDVEGHRYVDAISSWWCCNLGHSHPRMVASLKKQCGKLQHSILGNLTHPKAIELAAKLIKTFPTPERRVLFASDGASAVEAAMRMAVQYWHNLGKTEKNRFAALEGAYHGDTLGAMSLGFMPSFHAPYRKIVNPVFHAAAPFCAGCRWGRNPANCRTECLAGMRQIVDDHADKLAAVVVEPHCQGAAGMRIYAPAYLSGLADICAANDVLLIVDEIAMGFGRTGRMFSFEHAGIDPDIVCLGKGLSGGYLPVSAAVAKEHIYNTFTDQPEDHTFYHGHTFAGNPMGMTAALTCLEIYEDENIAGRAEALGRKLGEAFEVFKELDCIEHVRHLGMVAAFDVKDGADGETGAELAQQVRKKLLPQGVLLRPLGNVLYLLPPLTISEDILHDTIGKLFTATSGLA